MPPIVSIVIPVYNGADYVGEAIESALGQTYPRTEVLVINDGSDDGGATADACQAFGERIRYFEKGNGGVGSALNYGARQMRGEYFAWLSHDDRFFRIKTELQIKVFEKLEDRNTVLFGDWETIDASGRLIGKRESPELTFEEEGGHGWQCLLRGHMNGCTMLFHKSQFDRHGYFDESLIFAQDYDYWMRMLSGTTFLRIPVPLVTRRHHEAQFSHNPGALGEGTRVWRNILLQTPETIQISLHGSRQRFWAHMGEFLREHYPEAAAWSRKQAELAATSSRVSVVFACEGPSDGVLRSLASAHEQDYPELEIVAVCHGTREQCDAFRAAVAPTTGTRLLHCPSSKGAAAWNTCVDSATGEYLAFLRPGDLWSRDKIRRQVALMQSEGVLFSHTAYEGRSLETLGGEASIALSTVMLHRSVVAGGSRLRDLRSYVSEIQFLATISRRFEPLEIGERLSRLSPVASTSRVAALVDWISACCVEPDLVSNLGQVRNTFQELADATEPGTGNGGIS